MLSPSWTKYSRISEGGAWGHIFKKPFRVILRFGKDGDTRGAGFRWEEGAPLSSLGQYAKGDRPGDDLKSDKEGGIEEEQR